MLSTALIFLGMKYTMGIRMSRKEEILGADWSEHNVSDTLSQQTLCPFIPKYKVIFR